MAEPVVLEAPPGFERTVGSEIRRVFPRGLVFDPASMEFVPDWLEPPFFPADLFAIAGHLLEASGAYQYIVAPAKPPGRGYVEYEGPTLAPSQRTIDRWTRIGRAWATDWDVRDGDIAKIWQQLLKASNEKLVVTTTSKRPPSWWRTAHALLVIADEASGGMGYEIASEVDPAVGAGFKWATYFAAKRLDEETKRRLIKPSGSGSRIGPHVARHVALDSVAPEASREMVRVLPKGRTASLGCTFRTLSHNLALMPAHGRSNVYWHQPRTFADVSDNLGEDLNVLLVPYPYRIEDGCFSGELCSSIGEEPWGRYKIEQKWLRSDELTAPDARRSLVDFIDRLISQAEVGGDSVHAVVLPELALDWDTYDALARRLLVKRPNVEMLMSGVSKDCMGETGNIVTSSLFHSIDGERFVETHSRRKHHRWRLTASQIADYGLSAELDPEAVWWEFLEIGERVLNIDVLRQSTVTAVICEDLARVDPGLAALRLLGPNLVIALLMDGPQLKNRWPAIYAGALAEDPGSSVLTLTSLGLVSRSNEKHASARQVVAFWRDYPQRASAPNNARELELPQNAQALLLRLKSEPATETTLDGRPNSDAVAWIYRKDEPISITRREIRENGWGWIVGQ